MTAPVESANSNSAAASTSAVNPSSANPATAGAVASANNGGSSIATIIGSLADLKNKAPELYQEMMKGIAMHVCGEMKAHQERLKKLMRESNP